MKLNSSAKYFIFLLCALLFSPFIMYAQKKDFVLVLDAGHGGRDPGAAGRISKEKSITLAVVKKLGNLIEKNMQDVKVIYTRKTDIFIPLEQRATIANDNHADMFISVHVNAAKNKSAYGVETYTLGLAKTKANLDVAMTENSVILLEDDYKTRYRGFDPNSVDSYIMFEFMMDKYLDNSIAFATHIQNQFVCSAKRYDRGVRQAGFWVLHRSACPSVLIELGFISNYNEEIFLAGSAGQLEMAQAIYKAFEEYKKNHDKRLGYANTGNHQDSAITKPSTPESSLPEGSPIDQEEVKIYQPEQEQNPVLPRQAVFKLQILISKNKLNENNPKIKGLENISYYKEGNLYKYTVGADTDYEKINQMKIALKKRFPDAFIIAFLNGKKISVNEALKNK